jgi:hypothetical protein
VLDASVLDASVLDASVLDAAMAVELLPADAAAVDGSVTNVCPPSACPLPEYPCAPSDDGIGHTCLGQYATWPMPDAQPGSQVAPKYEVRAAAGVVLDEVTGLLWQRELPSSYPGCTRQLQGVAGASCTWREAKQYCAQLTLDARAWRLPSKIELESLIDFTQSPPAAYIDRDSFPGTPAAPFWTVSRVLASDGSDGVFDVRFNGGISLLASSSEARRVRCVHSTRIANAPADGQYIADASSQTVRDPRTKLEWRSVVPEQSSTAQQASEFCASVGAGFRVPSAKELLTLANVTHVDGVESPMFADLSDEWLLWSTTRWLDDDTLAYWPAYGFTMVASQVSEGSEPGSLPAGSPTFHTRCVR